MKILVPEKNDYLLNDWKHLLDKKQSLQILQKQLPLKVNKHQNM